MTPLVAPAIPTGMPRGEQDDHFAKIMEELSQLQRLQGQGSVDISGYAIAKILEVKMSECEKYADTSCPKIHLEAYLARRTLHSYQTSLTGAAL